jgi:hypothetical protein
LAAPVLSVLGRSIIAIGVESDFGAAVWVGPFMEEAAKAIGIALVVVLSREFDNPTDGVVYGTACGLGFAATENLVYTVAGVGVDVVGETLLLVLLRTALAAGIHAMASATLGGCLGFAYLSRNSAPRLGWSLTGLAVATAIHAGWNFMLLRMMSVRETPMAWWFFLVPVLYALYVAALCLFLKSEQQILSRELAEEVELDVLPRWILDVIPYYRRRVRSDWWPSRRERAVLARLLTRLAFRKHAVKRLPDNEAELAGIEVVQLRQRIRAMIGSTPDAPNV